MTASTHDGPDHQDASLPAGGGRSADVGPTPGYPPEADPDKAGDLPAAEVAGEQTDPGARLTGGDQVVTGGAPAGSLDDPSQLTADDLARPEGGVEPPD
ncbi:hypothetical protein [Aquipuribacter hungaricus]|uniref:Uncharacterized protein n=1 Tax=Aquipuribacter hungaricus TaxID=545624 RepID=A0ABV7WCM7_9MICO